MTIKRILVIWCTTTLLFMMFHDTTGQSRADYGESCSNIQAENKICVTGKYLICNTDTNNRSVCGCEPEMYYESLRKECVSVVGGDCFTNSSATKNCILNSSCNNSKCECNEGFLPANLGQCLLSYNEECRNSQNCSDLAFLTCKRGRCDCINDETQIWSHEEKRCSILLNKSCNKDASSPTCVTNAECNNETNTCVCKVGFVPDSDRCAVGYNGNCTSDSECSGQFICNNGTGTKTCGCDTTEIYDGNLCLAMVEESCQKNPHCVNGASCQADQKCRCNIHHLPNPTNNKTCSPVYGGQCDNEADEDVCSTFPEYSLQCNPTTNKCICKAQYEHHIDGRCHGLLNAPCTNISLCHDYAQCSNNGNDSKCICKSDFTLSPSGDECLLKYNAACENVTGLKCNSYEFLTCSDNRCLCENPLNMTFQQKCVALAESLCMTKQEDSKQLTCITNAYCQPTNSSTGFMDGICSCNEGFTPDETRMCIEPNNSSNSIHASIGTLLLIFIASINA